MISTVKNVVNKLRRTEAHDNSQYYISQWQRSPGLHVGYLIYRWFVAAIFIYILCVAVSDSAHGTLSELLKFFIYLTNWGFMLCTLSATFAAILVSLKYCELKRTQTECEKLIKLRQWSLLAEINSVFYNMAVGISLGITIIFWAKVYVPKYHSLNVMTYLLHGLNSVLMLLDVLIVAHPIKLLHVVWTLTFVIIYLAFTYIYYLNGGTNWRQSRFIYHDLNWQYPMNSLQFCFWSLLFGVFLHTCIWLMSVIVRKLSGANESALDLINEDIAGKEVEQDVQDQLNEVTVDSISACQSSAI